MTRSLESVLGGHRPRAHTVGVFRVDQHGRLLPPVMPTHSAVMQQDPRRLSEASIAAPPRPPPPNLKVLRKIQRINQGQGSALPQQMVPPTQPQPQQVVGGSNLAKMAQLARSTPQLDEYSDSRERDRERIREREKGPQNTKEGLIAQASDAIPTDQHDFYAFYSDKTEFR